MIALMYGSLFIILRGIIVLDHVSRLVELCILVTFLLVSRLVCPGTWACFFNYCGCSRRWGVVRVEVYEFLCKPIIV